MTESKIKSQVRNEEGSPREHGEGERVPFVGLGPEPEEWHLASSGSVNLGKMHNVRAASFIGGKMKNSPGDSTFHTALRNCKRGRGNSQNISDFGEGGVHSTKHIFFQKVSTNLVKPSLVTRNSVTMMDFSAFLDMRRYKNWAHKISSWDIYLKTCPTSFPWAQSASFLVPTLNSFRECWKSAVAAASDLILIEVDDKCQCVVDRSIRDFLLWGQERGSWVWPGARKPASPGEGWGRCWDWTVAGKSITSEHWEPQTMVTQGVVFMCTLGFVADTQGEINRTFHLGLSG